MSRLPAVLSAALAVTLIGTALAEAQSRRYNRNARTIYVQPRSFLDAGKVVPVGSLSQYVYMGQYNQTPPYYNQINPGRSVLPVIDGSGNFSQITWGPLAGY